MKFLKKSLFACLISAAAANVASAEGPVDCSINPSGFKLGLGVGINNTLAQYSTNETPSPTALISPNVLKRVHNSKINTGKVGFAGELFGGYGHSFGNALVGFELGFHSGSPWVKATDNPDNCTDETARPWNVKYKQVYGASLAPVFGYLVTRQTVLYTKIGIDYSKYRVRLDRLHMISANGALGPAGQTYLDAYTNQGAKTVNKSKVAFLIGLGADFLLNQNFFLRLEGTALFGPKVKLLDDQTGQPLVANSTYFAWNSVEHQFKVQQYKFMVGFGYKFGGSK